jgi:hypothetical protein
MTPPMLDDDWKPSCTVSPCCASGVFAPAQSGKRDWYCSECGGGEIDGRAVPPLGRLLTVREAAGLVGCDPHDFAAWVVEQRWSKVFADEDGDYAIIATSRGPRVSGGWVRRTLLGLASSRWAPSVPDGLAELQRVRQQLAETEIAYLEALHAQLPGLAPCALCYTPTTERVDGHPVCPRCLLQPTWRVRCQVCGAVFESALKTFHPAVGESDCPTCDGT